MVTLITIFHVFACLFLVLTVLLQAGKGGGVGAALGGQTSAAVFGGRGAGTFLEKLTSGTAIVFMVTSMSLAYIASRSDSARLQKRTVELAEKKKKDDAQAAEDKVRKDADDRAAKDKAPTPSDVQPASDESTKAPADVPKDEGAARSVAPVAPKAAPAKTVAPVAPKAAAPSKSDAPKVDEPKAPDEPTE